MPAKTCTKCGVTYASADEGFHRNGSYWRGDCKECNRAKNRRYRADNPGKMREYEQEPSRRARTSSAEHREHARRYYERHRERIKERRRAVDRRPEDPEKKRERDRAYRVREKDRRREQNKRWLERNPEYLRKYSRKWREQNPDYARDYAKDNPEVAKAASARRRNRKLKAGGNYTAADVRRIYAIQEGRCYWCKSNVPEKAYHADHRVPLSRGGSNGPENIVVSCPSCNLRKGAKMPEEFAGVLL